MLLFFFDLLAFHSKGIYKGIQPKRANTQQTKDKQKASMGNKKSIIFFKNNSTRGCTQGCVNKFFKS